MSSNCQLCGEPMPEGEEMFNYHGHSGPCPKPPKVSGPKKPETLEEWRAQAKEFIRLLIECRDALPAISLASAKLHGVDLSLADRIEAALEPWRIR